VLAPDFLSRFEKIIAVDPDPLAELIFKRRFAPIKASLQWDSRDYFIKPGCSANLFCGFLSSSGGAAVLFSNFLGQMPFLMSSEKQRAEILSFWQKNLLTVLAGRSWASFHDRYSCRKRPVRQEHFTSPEKLCGDALIKRYYGADARGTWVDHQTEALLGGQGNYDYFLWELTARAFHIIEGVYYNEQKYHYTDSPDLFDKKMP